MTKDEIILNQARSDTDAAERAVLKVLLRSDTPVAARHLQEETYARFDINFVEHRKAVKRLRQRGVIRFSRTHRAWHVAAAHDELATWLSTSRK